MKTKIKEKNTTKTNRRLLKEKSKSKNSRKGQMEIKEYIKKGDTDDIKDIFKIRLHMRDVKKN